MNNLAERLEEIALLTTELHKELSNTVGSTTKRGEAVLGFIQIAADALEKASDLVQP